MQMNDYVTDFIDLEDIPAVQEEALFEPPAAYCAPDKALAVCINAVGRVDLPYMRQLSGLSTEELTDALCGTLSQDPEGYAVHQSEEEDWLLREQYLSGNLKSKLDTAQQLNKRFHRFDRNIAALKAALPPRISLEKVGITLGSPWIPASLYRTFVREILALPTGPDVFFSSALGQWKVSTPPGAAVSIHNRYTYGTPRLSALKIMEMTLNARTVKVYDEVSRPERKSGVARVLNKPETLAAQEKQHALQQAFQDWIFRDEKRVNHLETLYYDTYCCNVSSRFDGSFLRLPDLNPAVTPFRHQRNAVARIVLDKNVLLNHAVGSGKTYEIIIGVHERKRMGLSPKNLVVVPNNMLDTFADAHRLLYPDDLFLVISPGDFTPSKRSEALERLRDGDYVSVYMAYSSFDRLELSRAFYLEQQAESVRAARAAAAVSTNRWEQQSLEHLAQQRSAKLQAMMAELPEDVYPPFDTLGVTTLVVDEAHNYKNISLNTHSDGVVGMHAAGSKCCDKMLEKVRFTQAAGGSVIFSTGTPLTNSISDLFVLQTFLQPEQLELLHVNRFDQWVNSFALRQSGFEIDVDSQSFRVMTRFSRFHNLPELTSLFANVCDFYQDGEGKIGLPRCGAPIITVVPKSPEQQEYIEELVLRTELIRAKLVSSSEDNLLKVTHDGRVAAMDIRLVEPDSQPERTGTKVYACAKNVYGRYRSDPGTAQLVFCDVGTPKKGFNLYDELRRILVEMGIPKSEIAYIHDAGTENERRKLFSAVNRAEIRVLLGSTQKLGTGVNVQNRLIAIHHLDVSWRPSDLIQREGRLIRRGNTNQDVYVYRYVTAGTFDAYSWQILENKLRFISQFMSNTLADREARDLSDTVLSYAEIKALAVGDPLLKTRVETGNLLERKKIQQQKKAQELSALNSVIRQTPAQLTDLKNRQARLKLDRRHFVLYREPLSQQDRIAFGQELLAALEDNICREEARVFDTLHGFQVLLPPQMDAGQPHVLIAGVSGNQYESDMREAKPLGCVQRLEHLLLHLDDRIRAVQAEERDVRKRCREAEKGFAAGNSFDSEVTGLTLKLEEIDAELARRAEESAA